MPSSAAHGAAALASAAPPPEPMPEPSAICQRFSGVPVPPADFAKESEGASLKGCDAEALYYGLGASVDFVRARECALATRQAPGMPPLVDAGILMMLYENGLGVPTNHDLALRFACEWADSPTDLALLLGTLWGAKTGREPLSKKLDECEQVSNGACDVLATRLANAARALREQAATQGMPPRELKALQAAAEHYFELRTSQELDQTGPMSARQVTAERANLRDELSKALEQLHDPAFTLQSADARSTDSEIAKQIRLIGVCPSLVPGQQLAPGAVTRVAIQHTQLAWKAYRDAFVALALALRPSRTASTWQAWLGQARLAQLRELAAGC